VHQDDQCAEQHGTAPSGNSGNNTHAA
jgi:hypothetical protein